MELAPAILLAVVTAVLNGAVTYGVVRTQLAYMKRDIGAAHRRLDKINAPAADWRDAEA